MQYMHIPDTEKCNWLRARIETAERQEYNHEEKLRILDRCACLPACLPARLLSKLQSWCLGAGGPIGGDALLPLAHPASCFPSCCIRIPCLTQPTVLPKRRLTWSEMFESFLANKYTAAKRFGLEGCEALIPGMKVGFFPRRG